MLRTQRQEEEEGEEEEEEEEEEGDIFILHYCTAVRGGPQRAHQTLQEQKHSGKMGEESRIINKSSTEILMMILQSINK